MSAILEVIPTLPAEFSISSIQSWPTWFTCVYCGLIALGLEILSHIVHILFGFANKIPVRGFHLDEFASKDRL